MAFKRTTRQITVEKRSVAITDFEEASRIIADFESMGAARFNERYGCRNENEATALTYAAASYVVSYLAPVIHKPTCDELGVKLCPDSPAEPTWTSEDGTTIRLRDMPTQYLQNVRRFAARMVAGEHGGGLLDAIDNELRQRTSRAA